MVLDENGEPLDGRQARCTTPTTVVQDDADGLVDHGLGLGRAGRQPAAASTAPPADEIGEPATKIQPGPG